MIREIMMQALLTHKDTLLMLNQTEYSQPIVGLSGASIGAHTRHIIEVCLSLLNGYEEGIIYYDRRKRNMEIQTNIQVAIQYITAIINRIALKNKPLIVVQEWGESGEQFETYFDRELLFVYDHCIHHQALIKVGFIELNKNIHPNFGVAISTLTFREKQMK